MIATIAVCFMLGIARCEATPTQATNPDGTTITIYEVDGTEYMCFEDYSCKPYSPGWFDGEQGEREPAARADETTTANQTERNGENYNDRLW